MADWDDDSFEPAEVTVKPVVTDKWEGEDEDDDVKDAWDASSDEDSQKTDEVKVVQKKKKKLKDIIAEKEEAKQREYEERLKAEEEEKLADTPEGKLAEKLRIKEEQEEDQRRLAQELLGVTGGSQGRIDSMKPSTSKEFEEFCEALSEKIGEFKESEHYADFAQNLIKNISIDLNTTTLKKIKSDVEAFHSAKLKEEKAAKAGKKPAKNKGTLKYDLDKDLYGGSINNYDNDMDDFM